MSIWSILGIEPTSDITAIKTAYAARAKECHPEEHPQEFQQLQKAYKSAVQYAKLQKKNGEGERVVVDLTQEQAEQQRNVPGKGTEPIRPEEEKRQKAEAQPIRQEEKYQKKPEAKQSEEKFQGEPEAKQSEEKFRKEPEAEQSEEKQEASHEYSYEEVRQDNSEECFFEEFYFMLWHPYLRNDLSYWKYFLNRPQYQKLFQNDDFRRRFTESFCRECFGVLSDTGLTGETLQYFDACLQKYHTGKNNVNETVFLRWRRKLRGRRKKVFITQREKEAYKLIWDQEFLFQGCLSDQEKIQKYLKFYFPYAREHEAELRQVWEEAITLRLIHPVFMWGLIIILVVFLASMGWYLLKESIEYRILRMQEEEKQGTMMLRQEEEQLRQEEEQLSQELEQLMQKVEEDYEELMSGTSREEIEQQLDEVIDEYDEWYAHGSAVNSRDE